MSMIGLGVALVVFLIGAYFKAPLTVGLFVSLTLGSTAFATIGGSSPLIYTLFAIGLIGSVVARKTFLRDLGTALARHPTVWLMLALTIYVAAGAVIMPRLFFNSGITAFIPIEGAIRPVPLGPTNGNITQTAYFTLGVLTFLALTITLLRPAQLAKIRLGLFAYAIACIITGFVDLAGKIAGIGDVFEPIRTASYAMLTDVVEAGFFRVVGGFSEASAYAGAAIPCLAFTYTYWRRTKSVMAQMLTGALGILLLLSTSSTAFGGLGVLGATAAISLGIGAVRGRLKRQDWFLLAGLLVCLVLLLGIAAYNEAILKPFVDLFTRMVLEKGTSESAIERGMWNAYGVKAFLDTNGLGIGMGSSRTSSWLIAAISQFGVIGMAMVLMAIAIMTRGMGGIPTGPEDRNVVALAAGARACGLATLAASTISGGSADPGILFFVCLAVVISCRKAVHPKYTRLQYQRSLSQRMVPNTQHLD